ncbi:MAG TPA: ABC transporter ATP-binding protein [Firmicutes bacterium]|nr:ABC transporter ATP-binding protein [Bacillota bacterium]
MSPAATMAPGLLTSSAVNSASLAPVRLEGVVKEYRDFTLGPIDLELEPGCITALIGPNGAGKTTLLRLIMGMARPTRGRVTVFGLPHANNHHRILSRIGFVPEEPFLYDELNLAWLGRFVSRLYPDWDEVEFQRLLARFDVPARKQVKELSKGTRVKAELALALAHHPDLLILDEPTSGLDPLVRSEVLGELRTVIAGIAASIWVLAAVAGISLLFARTSLAISFRWGVRAAQYLLYLPLLLTILAEIPGLKQAISPVVEAALTFWQRTNPSPAAVAVAVSVAILAIYLLLAAIAARLLESREV